MRHWGRDQFRRRRGALGVLIAATAFAMAGSLTNGGTPAGAALTGIQKIQHVVMVMQENRSFDHYFGTFPGANGIPMVNGAPSSCIPSLDGGCKRPYVDHRDVVVGGPHGSWNVTNDVDGTKMDGFLTESQKAAR